MVDMDIRVDDLVIIISPGIDLGGRTLIFIAAGRAVHYFYQS